MARVAAAAESAGYMTSIFHPSRFVFWLFILCGILTWTPKDYGVRVRVNLKKKNHIWGQI